MKSVLISRNGKPRLGVGIVAKYGLNVMSHTGKETFLLLRRFPIELLFQTVQAACPTSPAYEQS